MNVDLKGEKSRYLLCVHFGLVEKEESCQRECMQHITEEFYRHVLEKLFFYKVEFITPSFYFIFQLNE